MPHRWGSVFWRSWARVIRGRLPAIGSRTRGPNHGPRQTRGKRRGRVDRGRGWVQPGVMVGCAPRRACERRAVAKFAGSDSRVERAQVRCGVVRWMPPPLSS